MTPTLVYSDSTLARFASSKPAPYDIVQVFDVQKNAPAATCSLLSQDEAETLSDLLDAVCIAQPTIESRRG